MADGTTTSLMDGATDIADDHWSQDYEWDEGVQAQVGKFDSITALGKSYKEAQSQMGTMISAPKEGDTDAQRAEKMDKIHTQLGCPETAEGYKLEAPPEMPDGMTWSDEAATSIKTLAKSLGWNQAQLDGVVKWQIEQLTKAHQTDLTTKADTDNAKATKAAEAKVALKTAWGADKYEANLKKSLEALRTYGGDDAVRLFKENGLDNHPTILKMFQQIHNDKLAEDIVVHGDTGSKAPGGQPIQYDNSPGLKGS